jgi:hypothetical protein
LYFKTEFNKEFITIDPLTYPKYFNSKFPVSAVQVLSKEIENYLKLSKEELEMKRFSDADNAVSLDAVQVKAKKTPPPKDNRALMYNTPDGTVDLAKIRYGGAFSIFDVLKGRVAGVIVSGDRDDPTVLIRGVKSVTQSQEPLYLIDGVKVDKQTVIALNLDEVEKIDVLKSLSNTVKFGAEGANGVINVLTKRGNPGAGGDAVPDFLKMETRVGYNVFKEFYVPKYDQDLAANLRPDNRATVYWKAVLKTDKDGRAKVSYFNTDAETQMRVHVEGISTLGLLGDKRISYPVSR